MVPDGRTDGRTDGMDGRTDGRTHGRRQNYIPPTSSGDKKMCSGHNYSTNKVRGQRETPPKMVCDTPPSKVASTHQIWDSYL